MAYRRRQGDPRQVETSDETDLGLTRQEGAIITLARHSLSRAIEDLTPDGANRLALVATAAVGLFCDVVAGLTTARGDLLDVVNKHLARAGLQLVEMRRH
jgi:hypothetical protein